MGSMSLIFLTLYLASVVTSIAALSQAADLLNFFVKTSPTHRR